MKTNTYLSLFLVILSSNALSHAKDLAQLAASLKALAASEEEDVDRSCVCPTTSANFCNICVSDTFQAGNIIVCGGVTGATGSTGCTGGALVVNGGAGISGDLNVCGFINADTASTGVSTAEVALKNYKLQSQTILDANSTDGSLLVGLGAGPVANATGNTFVGAQAGAATVGTGDDNTALGYHALFDNTTGTNNVAVGVQALVNNTFGFQNVAVGSGSLLNNLTGFLNTAIGYDAQNGAGSTGVHNTVVGANAGVAGATAGSDNTLLGYNATASAGVTGVIVLGSGATATTSNELAFSQLTLTTTATLGANPYPTGVAAFLPINIGGTNYKLPLFNT